MVNCSCLKALEVLIVSNIKFKVSLIYSIKENFFFCFIKNQLKIRKNACEILVFLVDLTLFDDLDCQHIFKMQTKRFSPSWTIPLYEELFIRLLPIIHQLIHRNDMAFTSTLFSLVCLAMQAIPFKVNKPVGFLTEAFEFLYTNSAPYSIKYLHVIIKINLPSFIG